MTDPYREPTLTPPQEVKMRWRFRRPSDPNNPSLEFLIAGYLLGWAAWSLVFVVQGLHDPRVRRALIVATVATIVGLLLGTERVPEDKR